MNTIVRATFDSPEPVRRAIAGLRSMGQKPSDIVVCAIDPEIERRVQGAERDSEGPSFNNGVSKGAAAGSAMGTALAASATLLVPAVMPMLVVFSVIGAGIGAMGGSVAGAILEAGNELDEEAERQVATGRILVRVTVDSGHCGATEAILELAGGHVLRSAGSPEALRRE